MELKLIIEKLQDFKPKVVSKIEDPTFIQTYKMLESEQIYFSPESIYVGLVSILPSVPPKNTTNLICISDTTLPIEYRELTGINLILIPPETKVTDVLNRISDIMSNHAVLYFDMQRLMEAFYSGLGLQYLVDEAFKVFGNPIFINDTAFKILAISDGVTFDDPTLEEEKNLGYIHSVNVRDLQKYKVLNKARVNNYPVYCSRGHGKDRWLLSIVKINNIEVGTVGVLENERPFRDFDLELLDYFSKLVGMEMQKNDFINDNQGIKINYFLGDVLNGQMHSKEDLNQRLAYINWKVEEPFTIMVILDNVSELVENRLKNIAKQIINIFPNSKWVIYEKQLTIFHYHSNVELMADSTKRKLIEFLSNHHLYCGISNPFDNLLYAKKYYYQAVNAIHLGIKINSNNYIFHYSDYTFAHMVEILSNHSDLREFYHPSIKRLEDYDKKNNSNLLETLEMYFHCAINTIETAKQLHIHRNTLLYRINKIKELADIDFQNGNEILKLYLSLMFMKLQPVCS